MAQQQGFSAIELVVACAMLVLVIGLAMGALTSSVDVHGYLTLKADAEARSRQAGARMYSHLKHSDGKVFLKVLGPGKEVQLLFSRTQINPLMGWVTSSPVYVLGFELNPDEIDNGIDNDGNGLVDDGALYLTSLTQPKTVFLSNVLPDSFDLEAVAGTEQDFTLRFQTALRADPRAGVYDASPSADGRYPDREGFVVVSYEQRLTLHSLLDGVL